MSLNSEKRESIILYLLEKIDAGDASAVRKTAESFGVTAATVYKYLNILTDEEVVRKVKRGSYALQKTVSTVRLSRSKGEITSEQVIFEKYIRPAMASLPKNALNIWAYICSEMVNNVIDHSEAENVTIIVTTDYLNTSVLLMDDGVGIFEKIRSYFGYPSVDDAVSELFKGKLTTDSKNHSGEGIFFSSRMADRFAILSSERIFAHDKFDPEDIQSLHEAKLFRDGTEVFISLSNRTKKEAKDIFDEFADVEGGFTKTHIKLSGYFDSAPVSRSQAKRLCNRLNSFKEVELDFTGIEWMGQGFAHQLFCVFAGENPEVTLLPTGMNEDVRRMYNHVTLGQ